MIFNYLQNNESFNDDFPCIENKLVELIHNNLIDENLKITNPIREVLNFPQDDSVDTRLQISSDNCTKTAASQFNEKDATTSFCDIIATPKSHTDNLNEINGRKI